MSGNAYIYALATILAVLFIPAVVIALSRRSNQRHYLTAAILWGIAASGYIIFSNANPYVFILIAAISYIFLMVYLLKEKKRT